MDIETAAHVRKAAGNVGFQKAFQRPGCTAHAPVCAEKAQIETRTAAAHQKPVAETSPHAKRGRLSWRSLPHEAVYWCKKQKLNPNSNKPSKAGAMKIEWSCSIMRGCRAIMTTQRPRPRGHTAHAARARVVFAHPRARSSHLGSMLCEARNFETRVKTEPPQTHATATAKEKSKPSRQEMVGE